MKHSVALLEERHGYLARLLSDSATRAALPKSELDAAAAERDELHQTIRYLTQPPPPAMTGRLPKRDMPGRHTATELLDIMQEARTANVMPRPRYLKLSTAVVLLDGLLIARQESGNQIALHYQGGLLVLIKSGETVMSDDVLKKKTDLQLLTDALLPEPKMIWTNLPTPEVEATQEASK